MKFAEIRGLDTGVVRFSKEHEAEFAISKSSVAMGIIFILMVVNFFLELMDGSRFDGRMVEIDYF